MSNPILTNTYSKLDIRVKEPSGVVPPSGVGSPTPDPGSPDRFKKLQSYDKLIIFYGN